MSETISQEDLNSLKDKFKAFIGLRIDWLSIPADALEGFEPSQIAVIINTLLDAALPQIEYLKVGAANSEKLNNLKLSKPTRTVGQRESYPDYVLDSDHRVELKGLFVDNTSLNLKRPPTKREPSARLKENITLNDIDSKKDVLLVAAVRLEKIDNSCVPVVIDIDLFPMIECIKARDKRLLDSGGKWINGMPSVISNNGQQKIKKNISLTDNDYEKDTNFGKLKRIPYEPLQSFMKKHGAID